MSKRLNKKREKFKLKKFQLKMIEAVNLGLNTFDFSGKTYMLSYSNNFAQTLIDHRILYRIDINKRPQIKRIKLGDLKILIKYLT
ncbi:hypothetical protein [Clostridium sp. DJ247]|uniref:hypothetical protein n=1 Tax=Clostridium sp. DJ247 TaxID=2726188 RepID=UPI00162800FA|nr:hypothetical protein [Clostridium sp. DJ247]MBC2579765.1 hypothetical protein [Clostridium sp. DJ247]